MDELRTTAPNFELWQPFRPLRYQWNGAFVRTRYQGKIAFHKTFLTADIMVNRLLALAIRDVERLFGLRGGDPQMLGPCQDVRASFSGRPAARSHSLGLEDESTRVPRGA